jgi:hypothetical protein
MYIYVNCQLWIQLWSYAPSDGVITQAVRALLILGGWFASSRVEWMKVGAVCADMSHALAHALVIIKTHVRPRLERQTMHQTDSEHASLQTAYIMHKQLDRRIFTCTVISFASLHGMCISLSQSVSDVCVRFWMAAAARVQKWAAVHWERERQKMIHAQRLFIVLCVHCNYCDERAHSVCM